MAIRITEYNGNTILSSTCFRFNYDLPYTIMADVKIDGISFSLGTVFSFLDINSIGDKDEILASATGNSFYLDVQNDIEGAAFEVLDTSGQLGQYYKITMVREASNMQKAYINDILVASSTADVGTGRLQPRLSLMTGFFTGINGCIANIVVLQKALTREQIRSSLLARKPKFYPISRFYPLFTNGTQPSLVDYGLNQENLVILGTGYTLDNDPPKMWGSPPQLVGRRLSAAGGGEPPVVQTYRDVYVLKRTSVDNKVHYKQIVKR